MYTRASASDYDDFQAKGWTTKELIPLMKKHETYQRASQNPELHGFDGPIKVSFGNYTCKNTPRWGCRPQQLTARQTRSCRTSCVRWKAKTSRSPMICKIL